MKAKPKATEPHDPRRALPHEVHLQRSELDAFREIIYDFMGRRVALPLRPHPECVHEVFVDLRRINPNWNELVRIGRLIEQE